MAVELVGTEAWTLELTGRLPLVVARELTADLAPRSVDGEAEVGLLVVAMEGLGMQGWPGPRFSFHEALWRIGVELDGQAGWFGHTCDLDRAMVGMFGRLMGHYPVRRAEILSERRDEVWRFAIKGGFGLEATIRPTETTPEPLPPRPLVVGTGASRFWIPWREEPAPYRREAALESVRDELSVDTLGETVRWHPRVLLHRGRRHYSGVARGLRGSPP